MYVLYHSTGQNADYVALYVIFATHTGLMLF